jgi:NDP-sugar pyrophosphorylase family protein
MKAVILAGGLGMRLRPFTQVVPKPLLPIGEKSLLEIQLQRLRKHGFTHVYFATNYKADYIARFFGDGSELGIKIEYSKEIAPLGTAGPLTLLRSQLQEPFLVMNGDILTLLDFTKMRNFALERAAPLTVAIRRHVTPFAFGNIYLDGERLTGIQEKEEIVRYILAGIYFMQPDVVDLIPPGYSYGMDQLIQKLLHLNHDILKYEVLEYWLDIGQVSDYDQTPEIEKYFQE